VTYYLNQFLRTRLLQDGRKPFNIQSLAHPPGAHESEGRFVHRITTSLPYSLALTSLAGPPLPGFAALALIL
jgi:hypothetical protein